LGVLCPPDDIVPVFFRDIVQALFLDIVQVLFLEAISLPIRGLLRRTCHATSHTPRYRAGRLAVGR